MKKTSEFKPAWWLKNAHLQTVWPTLARSRPKLKFTRERFTLSDGDFLDLDWTEGDERAPIVVVLHGLGGSIHSPYAPGTLRAVKEAGWRGVLMHFRGCSGEHNKRERSYHAGDTSDLNEFIEHLHQRYPDKPIAAVGYSLGGNVLLKWLGEKGSKASVVAAIAVSVPFDLNLVLSRFSTGVSKFYSRHLLQQLRGTVVDKFGEAELAPIDVSKVKKATTFPEFDTHYTAPVHGFGSAYDYYHRASSRHYLKEIAVPTLILHAEDDPFMTPDAIPDDSELSESVMMEISPKGGHVGFISGKWPWQAEYWIEKRIPEFLEPFLK